MRLGQTTVIYLISRVLASFIGFLSTIYFARLLGENVIGYYGITLSLVSWIGMFGSIGFGRAMVKRISEGEEPEEYLTAGMLLKTGFLFTISLGVFMFRDHIDRYVGAPVAYFVLLLVLIQLFNSILNSYLKGSHLVHIYAPLSTVKQIVKSVLMVGLVYLGWELSGMLIGYAAGTFFVSTVAMWYIKPSFALPTQDHIRNLVNFAKYSWLGSLRNRTISDVDIIVLGYFVPAGLTGVYVVAYSLSEFLEIFGIAIKSTLFPEMSGLSASEDLEQIRSLTNDALTYAGLFLIPGLVGATIIGDRLLRIYGEGFAVGDKILIILLVGILAYTYNKQLLNTLNAIDRPDLAFRANAIFIISNLVLNITLVYTVGWVGAAIATASSAIIGLIVGFYYTRRQIPFIIPSREISKQLAAALLMGLTIYAARTIGELYWLTDSNITFVVLLVGLGAITYFAILIMISSQFRSTVVSNLPFTVPYID